ncbi:hypothetical protein B5X24_HaOG214768 [Helicoverpa armigera]|uniref:Uncharacterized protein n=1 Tax=Helicoverpa armigera TaxID=29058 RepID=A0A2W1BA20_HELAM|nr:hypothetical protein B5X24_HaOG214768 [Helicoverpa armigera]
MAPADDNVLNTCKNVETRYPTYWAPGNQSLNRNKRATGWRWGTVYSPWSTRIYSPAGSLLPVIRLRGTDIEAYPW